MEKRDRQFLGVSMGQAVILVTLLTQFAGIVMYASNVGTRIDVNTRDITDQKTDQRTVIEKIDRLAVDVGTLLERTKPKVHD